MTEEDKGCIIKPKKVVKLLDIHINKKWLFDTHGMKTAEISAMDFIYNRLNRLFSECYPPLSILLNRLVSL